MSQAALKHFERPPKPQGMRLQAQTLAGDVQGHGSPITHGHPASYDIPIQNRLKIDF